ncbi:integrator complex assembly factor WDR73 isoform X2 [Cynoglossus semilaevis]|uniref:integrator complex assembly factor WDR73 isoform X2 n=1 Tax=Cynoglossus semilaevis TaxID=244447 RepID=UPI000D62E120|nr:WD repeat-containing protein 73 isoform X2 [Cynoglossus semilaevis]
MKISDESYKDLHVFQMEHPINVMDWTSQKTVCTAGSGSSKSEILELCLPPKLFADENKSLCAGRDFTVLHGAFTDRIVSCLQHVPGTRCIVTGDELTSDLQVWDLGGDESDIIRRTGSIKGKSQVSEGGVRMATTPTHPPQILHGSTICDIHLTELNTGTTLYKNESDSAEPLSSLQFLNDRVFLASCCNGDVYIADSRMSASCRLSSPPESLDRCNLWWTNASVGPDLSSCRIISLSATGEAVVSDLRNQKNPRNVVSRAQLNLQTHQCNLDHVMLWWAPELKDCFSVSGFSGEVQIYDTSHWRTELQEVQPLFQHCGHAVSSTLSDRDVPPLVTSHIWHPSSPQTLLSAASDGSVHVWDWVIPSGPEPEQL